jgi:ABC-2 type transport system permease protein
MESHALTGSPTASSSGREHFLRLTTALASTEFKLRYFGSVLGYLWTLLRPLMLFGVLYVVFTEIVRFGGRVEHYPVMLLTGIVLFNFFGEATSGALSSLVDRENLIRKVSFPRAAVPIAVTLTAAANLVLGLVVVFALALVDGVEVRSSWLLVLPTVAGVVALAGAVALLLSVLYVRFRDMRPIWEVVLQLVFWGSPIIYTIEAVPESWRHLVMYNPFAVAIQQTRHWLVDPNAPTAADAIGGTAQLLIPLAILIALVTVSVLVFRQMVGRVAENL